LLKIFNKKIKFMITETELKEEIENVKEYISNMEIELKNEEDFELNFKQIERYRHYLIAF